MQQNDMNGAYNRNNFIANTTQRYSRRNVMVNTIERNRTDATDRT